MDFAEKDWVSVISEGNEAIVLARIEALKQQSSVTQQETGGILGMRPLRQLGGVANARFPEFDLAFLQFKEAHRRIKSGSQGWNGIDIRPAKLILVAAPLAAWRAGSAVEPVAVSEVSSENDPLVQGIETALVIEKERDPNQQQSMLSQALWSDLPVLGSYAQFSVVRLKRMPREKAIELEVALSLDETVPVERRLSAADALERGLWIDGVPGDTGNKRIFSVLFGLMGDPQPDVNRFLVPMLYRLLITQAPENPTSSHDYRASLLRGIAVAQSDALRNLQAIRTDPSLGDEASTLLRVLANP